VATNGTISSPPNTGNPGIDCARQKAMCGEHSGDLVVIDFPAGESRAYVHGTGWGLAHSNMPAALQEAGALTAAVPLRGYAGKEVFMCFKAGDSQGNGVVAYLYRYS